MHTLSLVILIWFCSLGLKVAKMSSRKHSLGVHSIYRLGGKMIAEHKSFGWGYMMTSD